MNQRMKTLSAIILIALAQSALANDPAEAQASVDCTAVWQNIQANNDRAEQMAGLKRWQEAVDLFREASYSASTIPTQCPALSKDAATLTARIAPSFSAAQTALTHQTTCQPSIDKALTADMRITSARQEGRAPKDMDSLLTDAENAWQSAAGNCASPHRERAERSLKAARKARADNSELAMSSPACDSAWKNATGLTDMAKEARKTKRWDDAAMLYGKSHLAWEQAAEKCEGTRRQTAERRISETELDAFNAEFCGPVWDEASENSQAHSKAKTTSTPLVERDQIAIRAEVSWRDAALMCRGEPQSIAKGNADAIARERGAPLPPNAAALVGKKRPLPTYEPTVATPAMPLPQVQAVVTTQPIKSIPVEVVQIPAAKAPAVTVSQQATPSATPAEPVEINLGGVIYRGLFHIANGQVVGSGKITWADGQTYTGALVDGKRSGKGKQTWPSGQWYEGDWTAHEATGTGVIFFPDGNRYEGTVLNGVMHGKGTLLFSSGDRYTGEFVQGRFNGFGAYIWKSGTRYDGQWKDGMKHGQGKMTMIGGVVSEGLYEADEETKSIRQYKLSQAQ